MIEQLKYLCYRLDYAYRFGYRAIAKKRLVRKSIGNKPIMTAEEANSFIISRIQSGNAFMAGRLGTIELSSMDHAYQKKIGLKKTISANTIDMLCNNAGFFPHSEKGVEEFSRLMLDDLKEVDLLGCWQDNELYYCKYFTNDKIEFCQLKYIEPELGNQHSWLSALKGKKVLVIHPYEKTILNQYVRRLDVFPNDFLPKFELKTIKAVQTIAGTKDDRFETWFDALKWMEERIDETDFDIALIGCGAYGFPLAAYIKRKGKQAIHIGGATQLIFGIIGSRWEDREYVKKCINQYWVHPLPEETPDRAKSIENACYW